MKCFFVSMLLIGVAFLFSKTELHAAEKDTVQKNAKVAQVQGPEIKFDKVVHDYGKIKQGDNGDCVFEFTNIGNEPLVLVSVRSSCGCTTPAWTREPIMPGKKGSIKVHYDTNRLGGIGKSVTVTTNGKTDRVILRITGNITSR